MEWLCSVGTAMSLALQPALTGTLFGNHPLAPETRDAFVTDLLEQTTVDERIGQLRLINIGPDGPKEAIREMIKNGQAGTIFNAVTHQDTRKMQGQVMELSRLKIPLFFVYDVLYGQHIVFPISLSLASSFSLSAVRAVGRISACGIADDGLNMTWTPMVDVSRDPRWDRVSGGFDGDTYLAATMGKTMAETMQRENPADCYSVMTSVKHSAAYGAVEGDKEYNTVDMNPQRLFNDYMLPYETGLDTGSGAVTVGPNSPNGTPAVPDAWLLKDVPRDERGFKGITVSDHDAIKELTKHGIASDPEDAVRVTIRSGIDMSMSDEYCSKYLPDLIKSGKVTMAKLDDAVCRVLNVKYDMRLFNGPYSHLGAKESDPQDTNAEGRLHRKEAREVARESLALPKNRLEALPLKKSAAVAVADPLADDKCDMVSSWSAADVADQSITVLTGIKNAIGDQGKTLCVKGANTISDKGTVDFPNLYEEAVKADPRSPQVMIDEAVNAAKQSDVIVAVVGETQGIAYEASSHTDITTPQSQRDLIVTLKATGKPLVLVLMNSRPLALVKEDQQAGMILETWFAGIEGGNAITDMLFDDYNPSGKLPMSLPHSVGQIPVYYSHLNTGRPYNTDKPNEYASRCFDEANDPLYPFGYGLSYITFTVSDVKLSSPTMKCDGIMIASAQVTNTGKHEGATMIQMYLQDVTVSMGRLVKRLKGFEKVNPKSSGAQTVSFPIDIEALRFWNQQMKYDAEPGKFNVLISMDSARVKQGGFELL